MLTLVLFALVGPLVGGVLMLIGTLALSPIEQVATMWGLVLLTTYVVGFIPALLTGLLYTLAPRALRRVVLSPLYGAAVMLAAFVTRRSDSLNEMLIAVGVGALAALICALMARGLRIG